MNQNATNRNQRSSAKKRSQLSTELLSKIEVKTSTTPSEQRSSGLANIYRNSSSKKQNFSQNNYEASGTGLGCLTNNAISTNNQSGAFAAAYSFPIKSTIPTTQFGNAPESEETFTIDNKTNFKMNTDFLMSMAKESSISDYDKENKNTANYLTIHNPSNQKGFASKKKASILESSISNELPKINCQIADIESESDDVSHQESHNPPFCLAFGN